MNNVHRCAAEMGFAVAAWVVQRCSGSVSESGSPNSITSSSMKPKVVCACV